MAFPIGLIFTSASYLLDRLAPMLSHAGAPEEAISGAKLLVALGPKAIQLVEDLQSGTITPEQVQQRWAEAREAVDAGNAAWEAAAPKP